MSIPIYHGEKVHNLTLLTQIFPQFVIENCCEKFGHAIFGMSFVKSSAKYTCGGILLYNIDMLMTFLVQNVEYNHSIMIRQPSLYGSDICAVGYGTIFISTSQFKVDYKYEL